MTVRTRRILLSVYSCEPNRGSEPGVGWNWALELQRQGHSVVVLTRANNRPRIDEFFRSDPTAPRPEFIYYDLPMAFLYLRRMGLLPVQPYYFLWQLFCVATAKEANHRHPFDLVWHLTFATLRWPSFLWRLGLPLVFGPVGGGERAPRRLRDFTLWYRTRETLRDLVNRSARLDPMCHLLFRRALMIFTTTPASGGCVPAKYRDKVRCRLAIGIDHIKTATARRRPSSVKILYVGEFFPWKGVALAIRAFNEFLRLGGVGRLTLLGKGPEEARLRALAREMAIDHLVDWISWVDHRDIDQIYAAHSLFLFPGLHDSGGKVVIEAMSHGLPIICLDLGGPAEIVKGGSGIIVTTFGLTPSQVGEQMAAALKRVVDDPIEFERMSAAAIVQAHDFLWSVRVSGAVKEVEAALDCRNEPAAHRSAYQDSPSHL